MFHYLYLWPSPPFWTTVIVSFLLVNSEKRFFIASKSTVIVVVGFIPVLSILIAVAHNIQARWINLENRVGHNHHVDELELLGDSFWRPLKAILCTLGLGLCSMTFNYQQIYPVNVILPTLSLVHSLANWSVPDWTVQSVSISNWWCEYRFLCMLHIHLCSTAVHSVKLTEPYTRHLTSLVIRLVLQPLLFVVSVLPRGRV